MHLFKVHFTMKLTYQTLPYDDDDMQGINTEKTDTVEDHEVETSNKAQWDDGCPWSEWYSAEDPVKGDKRIVMSIII